MFNHISQTIFSVCGVYMSFSPSFLFQLFYMPVEVHIESAWNTVSCSYDYEIKFKFGLQCGLLKTSELLLNSRVGDMQSWEGKSFNN